MTAPVARRWIISSKDRRRCWTCDVVGRVTAKVIDPVKGTIGIKCKRCGREERAQASRFKDRRSCETCGHVRDVTVSLRQVSAGNPELRERWNQTCDACDFEAAAQKHRRAAEQQEAAAAKIRQRRTAKRGSRP